MNNVLFFDTENIPLAKCVERCKKELNDKNSKIYIFGNNALNSKNNQELLKALKSNNNIDIIHTNIPGRKNCLDFQLVTMLVDSIASTVMNCLEDQTSFSVISDDHGYDACILQIKSIHPQVHLNRINSAIPNTNTFFTYYHTSTKNKQRKIRRSFCEYFIKNGVDEKFAMPVSVTMLNNLTKDDMLNKSKILSCISDKDKNKEQRTIVKAAINNIKLREFEIA